MAAVDAELARRGVRTAQHPKAPDRTVALVVLEALARYGSRSTAAIAEATGQTHHAAAQMLHKFAKTGEIQRVGRGVYALPAKGRKP